MLSALGAGGSPLVKEGGLKLVQDLASVQPEPFADPLPQLLPLLLDCMADSNREVVVAADDALAQLLGRLLSCFVNVEAFEKRSWGLTKRRPVSCSAVWGFGRMLLFSPHGGAWRQGMAIPLLAIALQARMRCCCCLFTGALPPQPSLEILMQRLPGVACGACLTADPAEGAVLYAALKGLRRTVARLAAVAEGISLAEELLPRLVPGLCTSYCSPIADVRKATVDCLVALWLVSGGRAQGKCFRVDHKGSQGSWGCQSRYTVVVVAATGQQIFKNSFAPESCAHTAWLLGCCRWWEEPWSLTWPSCQPPK